MLLREVGRVKITNKLISLISLIIGGDLYAATVSDFSGTDSLIIKNQLRTEQYDYAHLNGKLKKNTDVHDKTCRIFFFFYIYLSIYLSIYILISIYLSMYLSITRYCFHSLFNSLSLYCSESELPAMSSVRFYSSLV